VAFFVNNSKPFYFISTCSGTFRSLVQLANIRNYLEMKYLFCLACRRLRFVLSACSHLGRGLCE
ncbi:UNVERIFIED_CONTAM: hypothetical protein NY603_31015, partial [Bacteroidetes bacterium 56_B9]